MYKVEIMNEQEAIDTLEAGIDKALKSGSYNLKEAELVIVSLRKTQSNVKELLKLKAEKQEQE